MYKQLIAGLSLLSLANTGRADYFQEYFIDPEDGKFDASRYLSEVPLGFLAVPTIITEPAVGYGLGVGAMFFQESEEQRKTRTAKHALLPPNINMLGAAATENGTWGLGVGHLGFWRQDSIRYRGFAVYGPINMDFYSLPGVGDLPRPVELEIKGPAVIQQISFRIPETKLFVGAKQLYRHVDTSLASKPRFDIPDAITNYLDNHLQLDTTTSGFGVTLEYDSRNNPFNPEKGYDYSASYMFFDDAIGSDIDYENFNVTALNYWQLTSHVNLAVRLQLDGINADEHTRLPAYVPPDIKLRGVPSSRYQGARVAVAEVEVDYKFTPRWKVGVFTGMGRAADNFDGLGGAENVDSYGAGFRYLIARRYGFAMGIDVARGPEDTAFYIQAGSTW